MERLFFYTASTRAFPAWTRYAATTALVGAAVTLRLVILGEGPGYPFLFFFPVVVFAGVLFDRGTGIYAAILSSILAVWLFVPQLSSLEFGSPADLLAAGIYLAITLFVACLMEALHVAFATVASSRQQLAADAATLVEANRRLAASDAEKETLLREAIHRARNDLQRLAATLHLQIAATDDTTSAREALTDAVARIQALARVNGRLEQHWHSDSVLDSSAFLEGLGEDLREVTVGLRPITLRVKAEAHGIPIGRAIALGLIVNELVVNAVKYAFPDEQGGTVDVRFRREGDHYELSVADDGIGIKPGTLPHGTGLGMRLARALAAQLGGQLQQSSGDATEEPQRGKSGTSWVVQFPIANGAR
jgi:two-component sensor histidine kinase